MMPKRRSRVSNIYRSIAKRQQLRSDASSDRFTKLPIVVSANIFGYLSLYDRLKCQLVCRLFYVTALVGITRFDNEKDWVFPEGGLPKRNERVLLKICRALGDKLLHLSWSYSIPRGIASVLGGHCPSLKTFRFTELKSKHSCWRKLAPSFYRGVEHLEAMSVPAEVLCGFANLRFLDADVRFDLKEYRSDVRLRDFCNRFCASMENVYFRWSLPFGLLMALAHHARPCDQLSKLNMVRLGAVRRRRLYIRLPRLCPNVQRLSMGGVNVLSSGLVQHILRAWSNCLTVLVLSDTYIAPSAAAVDLGSTLASLTQLTLLELLSVARISNYRFLQNLRNLTYLGINADGRPSESCIRYIAPECRLSTLKLTYDHHCSEEVSITTEELCATICSPNNAWLGSLKGLALGQRNINCKYEQAMLLSYHRFNSLMMLTTTIDSLDNDTFDAFCKLSLNPSLIECFFLEDRAVGPLLDPFPSRFWRQRRRLANSRRIEPHYLTIKADSAFSWTRRTQRLARSRANVRFSSESEDVLIERLWSV